MNMILNRQQTLHLFSRIFSIYLMTEQTQSQMCHCFDYSYISLQGMFDFDNTRSVSLSSVVTEHTAPLNCLSCINTDFICISCCTVVVFLMFLFSLWMCQNRNQYLSQSDYGGKKNDGWILFHHFGFVKESCLQTQKLCYVSLLE